MVYMLFTLAVSRLELSVNIKETTTLLFIISLFLPQHLQTIVDHFESQKCPVSERLKLFYCSGAPPRWAVQVRITALLPM